MKNKLSRLAWSVILLTGCCSLCVMAGNLDSSAAPDNSGSAMYTLTDLYQRLNAGTTGAKRSGSFSQPSQGPTVGTMYTLNQIMALMPVRDDSDGATTANVLSGKPFWGLTEGQWGPRTGTMATRTLSPGSTTVASGYYAATSLATVDPDLTAGNIATNVTLFGIAGMAETNSGGGGAEGAPVPKTGQTTSYTPPSGTGSDGNLQMGVEWPDPRFTVQSDTNMVLDNLTGLMWARNGDLPGSSTWNSAIDYCNSLDCGGYDDWRLPNMNELLSLVAYNRYNPAIPSGHPFNNVSGVKYWSSTTYPQNTTYAWCVDFLNGTIQTVAKTSTSKVWPVRGGE
ncbi:MAG: DUF1566 domain-containing protein [Kiritimatiellae bacterium]|nr:DUF1566 domain-containing protein [Kiritimatiellia bacterium]